MSHTAQYLDITFGYYKKTALIKATHLRKTKAAAVSCKINHELNCVLKCFPTFKKKSSLQNQRLITRIWHLISRYLWEIAKAALLE